MFAQLGVFLPFPLTHDLTLPLPPSRVHVEEAGDHKGVELVFENILRQDRGNYTCSANVDGKEVSKSFELFVDSE